MFAKILIKGKIEVVTGMHIGSGGDYAAIGATDSTVVRDAVSGLPMIPGSSLKGKLRYLLSRKYNDPSLKVRTAADDAPEIVKLFGGTQKNGKSRLVFSDMFMCNNDELKKLGVSPTEVKYENTINRMTSVANPRQIERVIRQSRFDLNIIYNAENEADIKNDIALLADGMKLLQYDYLGGHGSRGYGKIKFSELTAETVVGNDGGELDGIVSECVGLLEEVSANEI